MKRACNRFSITVVFTDDKIKEKFVKMVGEVFADVNVVDKNVVFTGDTGKEEYPAVVIRCDSGSSSIVNGTAIRWDPTDDPDDPNVREGFAKYCINFPM